MNTHLKEIIYEMCSILEIPQSELDTTKHNWFLKYKWDYNKKKQFKQYFLHYLSKNDNARKELLGKKQPKTIADFIDYFIFNYEV